MLQSEVSQLMLRAEAADNKDLADGLSIPQEITRRQDRLAKLQQARQVIEERVKEETAQKQIEYEQKLAERERKKNQGKRPGGRPPQPPSGTPTGKEQYNFTDPESRIMKVGNGKHFEQCFDAQAAVDAEGSLLILGARVSDRANDKQELTPTVSSIPEAVGDVKTVLCDSGYYNEKQVMAVESQGQTTVYAAVKRQSYHRTLADLAPHQEPEPMSPQASAVERMAHRLRTETGKALYRLRKQTVEPVFGIIKEAMGFRRFSMRGIAKIALEWDLVCLAYNCKRLFNLQKQKAA